MESYRVHGKLGSKRSSGSSRRAIQRIARLERPQEELMKTDSVLTHDDLVVVEDPMIASDRVVLRT